MLSDFPIVFRIYTHTSIALTPRPISPPYNPVPVAPASLSLGHHLPEERISCPGGCQGETQAASGLPG